MKLKITFPGNLKVRIKKGFRGDADMDNVGGMIPIHFIEEYRIEV